MNYSNRSFRIQEKLQWWKHARPCPSVLCPVVNPSKTKPKSRQFSVNKSNANRREGQTLRKADARRLSLPIDSNPIRISQLVGLLAKSENWLGRNIDQHVRTQRRCENNQSITFHLKPITIRSPIRQLASACI